MTKFINSPIIKGAQAKYIREISVELIISEYKKHNIDVRNQFKGYKSISIYECLETTYRFYYPFDIEGDSKFYEHFQNFDWYYMPWKWEHEVTKQYLKDGLNVLEVGCAHGSFLKRITELFDLNEVVGLELNKTTPIKNPKWKIINQFVQDYQKENNNKFDIVCSYQVLEHICDVHSFIESKIACLKVGGKLIISVPNNESFIKDADLSLNMPPHHMGLWDTKSLKSLENVFNIKLVKFHYEELQDYHVGHYIYFNYYKGNQKILGKVVRKIHKLIGKYSRIEKEVLKNRNSITGHTVLVVYEKL
jgi:2-polyprenyl-3-methyl-5-hydroxy-6-metoxy-1,4-benzoquinol methylase